MWPFWSERKLNWLPFFEKKLSKKQLSNKIDSNNLDKRIVILEKFYHIHVLVGRRIERKPVSLTRENDPKQNYSSPANLKYKPRGLTAANNNVCWIVRKKVFAVLIYDIKCQKWSNKLNADELCYPASQPVSASTYWYCNFHIISMYHAQQFPLCIFTL